MTSKRIAEETGLHLGKTRHGRREREADQPLRVLGEGELILSGSASGEQAKVSVHMRLIGIVERCGQIDQAAKRGVVNCGDRGLDTEDPEQEFWWQANMSHDRALHLSDAVSGEIGQGIHAPALVVLLHAIESLLEGRRRDIEPMKCRA